MLIITSYDFVIVLKNLNIVKKQTRSLLKRHKSHTRGFANNH